MIHGPESGPFSDEEDAADEEAANECQFGEDHMWSLGAARKTTVGLVTRPDVNTEALASIERVNDDLQEKVDQFEEREDALRDRFQDAMR